jgi:hypothetical protein
MGVVMITCPSTGHPVSTGIETDTEIFVKLPDVLVHTRCPFCGLDHPWGKRDAWVSEAPPGGDSAAAVESAAPGEQC